MTNIKLTFDEVFKIWFDAEVTQIEGRDILPVAQSKGFNSIVEWRLSTALRLRMDKKDWELVSVNNPNEILPNIIIGPYQGWSKFFDNKLTTSFAEALEIPEFFEWVSTHDRIIPLSKDFPSPTTIILFQKENGDFICIEGTHRICAVAYKNKVGEPIELNNNSITAAIAQIKDSEIEELVGFLKEGTSKQPQQLS
jgi:hypothetical protein